MTASSATSKAAAKSKEAAERLAESRQQAVVFAQQYYALEEQNAKLDKIAGLLQEAVSL